MEPLDHTLRDSMGIDPTDHITTLDAVRRSFELSKCDVIACTHTCLPYAQRISRRAVPKASEMVDGEALDGDEGFVIINNGASGVLST